MPETSNELNLNKKNRLTKELLPGEIESWLFAKWIPNIN
jgi:hypothetical protein